MNRSDRSSSDHGWLYVLAVCGLMLFGIIALPLLGLGWGTAVLGVALIICLAAMPVMMRAADRDR